MGEHKLYHAKFGDLISNVLLKAKFVIDLYYESHFDFFILILIWIQILVFVCSLMIV